MEFKAKNGTVLVELIDASPFGVVEGWFAGKVVASEPVDKDITVFFFQASRFTDKYLVVKIEDILVWLKEENCL